MKPHLRNTQKDLILGFYWREKTAPNPGLNIWFLGRYIYPRKRSKAIMIHIGKLEPVLPFESDTKDDFHLDNGVRFVDRNTGINPEEFEGHSRDTRADV